MRLLSIGHYESPEEDAVTWTERFRIAKFSVVPYGHVAHGTTSGTQGGEFEI